METGVCIRKAGEQDAHAVYRLICELENTNFEFELFKQFYTINVKDHKNIYLVASVNGQVCGFISCHSQLLLHHMDIVYEIQEMYVCEEQRGKGLGIGLMKHLEKELKLRQCRHLEVSSNKLRDQAHEFYTSRGFNRTHYKFTRSFDFMHEYRNVL
ncbi:MAG: GNAT family N-acetyltransferase [Bacteroidetes bacterium]|nr:GNAT family N-acetyltransferase [Bacteroidota bacterium]